MKKLLFLSAVLFVSVVLYQCKRPVQTTSAEPVKYPNEASELALLMREMESEALAMRESIKKGEQPKDTRERFKAILTAQSTEASMKTPAFQAMAQNYLKSLQKVYEAPQDERMEKYTLLVNDCMNCHKASCPGPIPRIKKLGN